MNCVRRHGQPRVEDQEREAGVAALGVDEHKMLSANGLHHTLYVTVFVDVITGRLLDVVRGRNADDVAFWLSQATGAWRHHVAAVAIDPHRGYLRGLLAYLPDATVTVDCFHGVKLANTMVDDVRRRVQQETLGHRGRKVDPLFSTRRLMTRAWERLSDRQRDKLFSALAAGDPDGEVGSAVLGKELIREMYAARSLTAARWKLVAFYQHAAEADVPELTRLAKTVSAWEDEILNYHVTGISNGPTEAQNLIAEKVRRIAHGMRNFENYRLRLLLHSGVKWNTPSTARIRGRHPRLDACRARLAARGLLDSSGITQRGRELRIAVESTTDDLAARPLDAIAPEARRALLGGLRRVADAIYRAGVITYPNPMGLPRPPAG